MRFFKAIMHEGRHDGHFLACLLRREGSTAYDALLEHGADVRAWLAEEFAHLVDTASVGDDDDDDDDDDGGGEGGEGAADALNVAIKPFIDLATELFRSNNCFAAPYVVDVIMSAWPKGLPFS